MNRSYFIFFAIIIVFTLLGCENKDDTKGLTKEEAMKDSISFAPAVQKSNPNIPLITPDTLELLLPTKIPGAEKYPSNKGSQHYGDKSWTSASSEYSFDKGMLIIQINDYGVAGNMPEDEYRLFTFLPEIDGMLSKRVWHKDGKGYMMWDKEKGEGKLQILFQDRFVVNIDAYVLGKNDPGLEYYLNKVNVERFKTLSK